MAQFKGRVVVSGTTRAEALVSHAELDMHASYRKPLFFSKTFVCSDIHNPELYGKKMTGKALCFPRAAGLTTGGMIFYNGVDTSCQPACLLLSKTIDSLAATGAILADVWSRGSVPTVDNLGDDFLAAVKTGGIVSVAEDGTVTVE